MMDMGSWGLDASIEMKVGRKMKIGKRLFGRCGFLLLVFFLAEGSEGEPERPEPFLPSSPRPGPLKPAEAAKVRRLEDGTFAIGEVKINSETRHIVFPAEVNIDETSVHNQYKLEYALVDQSKDAKMHESLLSTRVSPFDLNLALKLLRYNASPELVPLVDDKGRPTGKYPHVPEKVRMAARVKFTLIWEKTDGTVGEASLGDWITSTVRRACLSARTAGVYGGSFVTRNGVFGAAVTGDIAGIAPRDNSGLFFYPGRGLEKDASSWSPTPGGVVPPKGTPVTVTIKPAALPEK